MDFPSSSDPLVEKTTDIPQEAVLMKTSVEKSDTLSGVIEDTLKSFQSPEGISSFIEGPSLHQTECSHSEVSAQLVAIDPIVETETISEFLLSTDETSPILEKQKEVFIDLSSPSEASLTPMGLSSSILQEEILFLDQEVSVALPKDRAPQISVEAPKVTEPSTIAEDSAVNKSLVTVPPRVFNQPSSPQENPSLLERSGYWVVRTEDLQGMVEKILRDSLNHGRPLYGLAKRLEDTVDRSLQSANSLRELEMELPIRVERLESAISQHDSQLDDCSEDIGHSFHAFDVQKEEMLKLRGSLADAEAKIKALEDQLRNFTSSQADSWKRHDLAHASLESRLTSWDEIRRLSHLAGSTEDPITANSLRMEGIQMLINFQIARGCFPRDLIHDPCFMDMVKDKDGLILQLNNDIISAWKQPWPTSNRGPQEGRAPRDLARELGPAGRRNSQR